MNSSISEPAKEKAFITANRLGTFGGVFTPSILTILGVIMFMRAGFTIGQAGIFNMLIILLLAKSITFLTSLSISAISTNTPVAGGGAYFLISRALGPEFGGAIGLALFSAQAISVPFYILGFTEALCRTFPHLQGHFRTIALATMALLFIITFIGAKVAVKTQYIIMTVLAVSIIAFMGGSLVHFRSETFAENWSTAEGVKTLSFWAVFAIYFPAVTGIMAGVNMSGDLKNPGRSIPLGTFAAVGVGFAIYALQILLCGGAQLRQELLESSFETLSRQALFGAGFLVVAGVFAATLSSALGSFLGSPRVLQAVARDKIIPSIHMFARGSRRGDEPHRALLLTLLVTLGVIFWAGNNAQGGAFNILASVVTMFFLYTYGMVNLAAFVESFSANPSFRPRFRYFHWLAALAGVVGCTVTAFLIDAPAALGAAVILSIIYVLLRRRMLRTRFGDARWGFVYSRVKDNVLRLARMASSQKNWRPTILVMAGNPEERYTLAMYGLWMGVPCGLVTLGRVLVGKMEDLIKRRRAALDQLNTFLEDNNAQALSAVVIADDIDEGLSALLQGHAVGPLSPNVVMWGWPTEPNPPVQLVRHLISARLLGINLVLLCDKGAPKNRFNRRIDIWWRGRENGALMVLLAHLLTLNQEWSQANIRLLRLIDDEAGRQPAQQALQELLNAARVDADVQIIVSRDSIETVLHRHSGDASVVFLGFSVPATEEVGAFRRHIDALLEHLPTTLLVSSTGEVDLMA
ncbi:MAG: amino acid permease [Sedimentisphaerales bacterium]|nr:amino acid permease [Sedimentisphaerales bacterium]